MKHVRKREPQLKFLKNKSVSNFSELVVGEQWWLQKTMVVRECVCGSGSRMVVELKNFSFVRERRTSGAGQMTGTRRTAGGCRSSGAWAILGTG